MSVLANILLQIRNPERKSKSEILKMQAIYHINENSKQTKDSCDFTIRPWKKKGEQIYSRTKR